MTAATKKVIFQDLTPSLTHLKGCLIKEYTLKISLNFIQEKNIPDNVYILGTADFTNKTSPLCESLFVYSFFNRLSKSSCVNPACLSNIL